MDYIKNKNKNMCKKEIDWWQYIFKAKNDSKKGA